MTDTKPIMGSGLTPLSTRAKATRGQTRLNNLRLALQLIYSDWPTSRAAVARSSHLTPATASGLVDELLELDLIKEVGTGPSGGGKPPTLIAPNPAGRTIIALDLSSADFLGALVDLSGEIVSSDRLEVTEKVVFFGSLVAGFNFFIGMFNFIPLLPLDGGHIAGALYEGLKRGVARLRGRPDPGHVDVARLLPVAYVVGLAMLVMGVVLIVADIVVPLRLS